MPILIGAAGLSAEMGFWFFRARQLQTAADLGAFAGSVSLRNQESANQAESEAAEETTLHLPALAAAVVTNTPPEAGAYRNARSMEVLVSRTEVRLFSAMFTDEPLVLSARAVATYAQPNPACLLALDIEASASVDFFGSSNTSLLNCEVMSNSIAQDAVQMRGSADLEAPCVNAVGGFELSGTGADLILTGCPEPRINLPRAPDPYEDVDEPDTSTPCANLGSEETLISSGGGVRRFCGGLSLNGAHHFEPGVYVVDGGTFRINAGANVSGEGVTFFLTDGARTRFNGSATIELSAPPTGDLAGLVFFGDRGDDVDHVFNGTANSSITGAMYFPAGEVSFLGDFSGDNGCMQIVARTIGIGGATEIETDCSGSGISWGDVPSDVRLVE